MSIWFMQLLPDAWLVWLVNGTLIVGAVSVVLSFLSRIIPFVGTYSLSLKVIGCVLLIVGAYFKGGLNVELEYRARILEMEQKIAIAEAKSEEENIKIVETIKIETEVVRQDTEETLYLIEQMKQQIDKECVISPEAIELYNQGVLGGNE
jgi:hypothetical protein